jgi:hypothetical protein
MSRPRGHPAVHRRGSEAEDRLGVSWIKASERREKGSHNPCDLGFGLPRRVPRDLP